MNLVIVESPTKAGTIEKYLGSEGMIPKLSTIGTKEWEKKKQKILVFAFSFIPYFTHSSLTNAFQYHSNGQSNQYFLKQLSLGNYCLLYFKIEWCI